LRVDDECRQHHGCSKEENRRAPALQFSRAPALQFSNERTDREMELTIDTILLGTDGSGLVTFRFNVGDPKEWVFEIPYSNTCSIDEGVKQAAALLAQFAKALAEEALALAEQAETKT
jgi:hypothetical protein